MSASSDSLAFVPFRAATLAVGTEVTDGQIIDRNSAWISAKLVSAGVKVIEHRAVADEPADITRALRELSERVDLLFVTGGLGPTSDDLTRDIIAQVFERPLEYDPVSWSHIEESLRSRGIIAGEIQKKQSYFPQGARVLKNPAGTANAFSLSVSRSGRCDLVLYALPGPPTEIAAVWSLNLEADVAALTPPGARENLRIIRCLGRAESEVAEEVEKIVRGRPVRVGYRAHVPYVEVKIWFTDVTVGESIVREIDDCLRSWLVNHDAEDVCDGLLNRVSALPASTALHIVDAATQGILAERVATRIKERRDGELGLIIETVFAAQAPQMTGPEAIHIVADEGRNLWKMVFKITGKDETVLEELPPYHYKVLSERGRRYVTEKVLMLYERMTLNGL